METVDEFSLHPRLAQTPGVSLVLFTSPTCGACRQVERLLPKAAPPGVRLMRVDVQQAQALAHAYEIFHLPTLILFRDGHYHARLACQVTPGALRAAIEQTLAAPAEEEP
jgi:thioredoxin-like negative regulator of GroEL